MAKHKTHKGLARRVRITRTGKVVRKKAGRSHLMSGKRGKRVRQLRRDDTITGAFAKKVKRELPT